jgi:hypothetical protein
LREEYDLFILLALRASFSASAASEDDWALLNGRTIMAQMADIPVNDIAPLVEIHDYTVYLFAGVMTVGIVVSISLVFFILKKWRNRRVSERHKAYKALELINMSDPKSAAYAISRIGYFFSDDNERTKQAYHNLFERLAPYKYAPVVDAIDEETLGYYHLYLEIIDV